MGYTSFKKVLISNFNRYPYNLIPLIMKSYSNPFIIGLRTIFGKYPFEAKLKGHEKVVITSRVYKITSYYAFLYLARKKVKN